jgi:acyl carrier protein
MLAHEVKGKLAEFAQIPVDRVDDSVHVTDLVADSFVLVEMMLLIQDEFNIELEQEDLEEVVTVAELVNLIQQKITAVQAV